MSKTNRIERPRFHHVSLLVSLGIGLCLLGGCGNAASSPSASAPQPIDITGGWKSECTPMNDTQAFSLDFAIAAKTWGVDYVVFGDKACSSKFLTVHIEGPYEIDSSSATVPEAREAMFSFTKKTVTPHSAAAASYLASDAGCKLPGFANGVAQDITGTGCGALGQYPVAKCPADYDLVKLSGDTLTFGARPADNDMCTADKRPKALSAVASRRK